MTCFYNQASHIFLGVCGGNVFPDLHFLHLACIEHIRISTPVFSIPFWFLCSAGDPGGSKALRVVLCSSRI